MNTLKQGIHSPVASLLFSFGFSSKEVPQNSTQSTTQGNMFTEAKKRAELFLPAHQGPLVQCGFLQHVNAGSSTAKK